MVAELEKLGAPYHAWIIEELAARPLVDMPQEILDDLDQSQVSIFAVQAQTNELRSRIQMTDVVNRRKIRHAHMVNINKQIMMEGMRADFQRVDRLSQKVVAMVRKASKIHANTAAGTDLTADLILITNGSRPAGLSPLKNGGTSQAARSSPLPAR